MLYSVACPTGALTVCLFFILPEREGREKGRERRREREGEGGGIRSSRGKGKGGKMGVVHPWHCVFVYELTLEVCTVNTHCSYPS